MEPITTICGQCGKKVYLNAKILARNKCPHCGYMLFEPDNPHKGD